METGGCPHTAIREDASMNFEAVEELEGRFDNLDLILIESGGDNLAAAFSPELVDRFIYIIDVAQGEKIPRKGGPGIMRSDLLIVNKIDLAPLSAQACRLWKTIRKGCAESGLMCFRTSSTASMSIPSLDGWSMKLLTPTEWPTAMSMNTIMSMMQPITATPSALRSSTLRATFRRKEAGTFIASKYHTAPIKIAKAFPLDGRLGVIVMDVSPGLLDGDRYDFQWNVEDGAHVYMTNQSFTKVHPSHRGKQRFLDEPTV